MKLAETCVKYPVFTVMLIAFLVTLGVFSYRGLAVDLFPKADPATVNVEVRLPGATPEEVVTGVVLPLEDAISSVSGIDEITVNAAHRRDDIFQRQDHTCNELFSAHYMCGPASGRCNLFCALH